MFSLPIARRELLVQAKSPALHKGRVKASIVLLLLGCGFSFLYLNLGLGVTRQIVHGAAFFAMMACAFGGMSATADCIAREKRDGTLGLLFLTPLTPAGIAAGKLIASGLAVFYTLLIALPLFSLFVIAGGIAWTEILGIAALSLNILFASAAIGLFASTMSLDRKKAHGRAVWLVLIFWWILPMAAEFAARSGGPSWVPVLLRAFSFSSGFGMPGMVGGAISSPLNFLCVHLLGWLFLAASVYFLPRRWQDRPAPAKLTLRGRLRQLAYGSGEARRALREKLLGRTPFFWLAARDRSRRWQALGSAVFVLAVLLLILPKGADQLRSLVMAVLSAGAVLQFLWTGAAAYQLELEREQGTVEMLLSTPLRPEDIIRGQWLALVRQYGGPVALVLAGQWFAAAWLLRTDLSVWPGLFLIAVSLLMLANFFALHQAALWSAVTVAQQKQAAGIAIAYCLILPAVATGILVALVGLFNWLVVPFFRPHPGQVLALWIFLQLASDIFWVTVARRRLPGKMREWAMRRYAPAPVRAGWLGVLSRKI